MPSYQEIIQLAIREIEIELYGAKIRVVQRLMKDPKPIQEARARLSGSVETLDGLIQRYKDSKDEPKGKTAAKKEDDESAADIIMAELESKVAEWRVQLDSDERMRSIRRFCAGIISVDVLDETGKPLTIEEKALYDSPIPHELFDKILEAAEKEPLIPKVS